MSSLVGISLARQPERVTECLNCGATLQGPYCAQCGQRDVDLERPLLGLIGGLVRETFDVDGRSARTLVALFTRPGLLSERFLAGERQRYTSPIRLYLVVSVLFFVIVAWVARSGILFEANENTTVEVNVLAEDLPRLMFVLLPFFALLLKAAYPKRLYFEHLVHSLHLHSAAYIVLSLALPLERAATGNVFLLGLQTLPFLYLGGYLLLSLRRVYPASWLVTGLKAAVIIFGYVVALALSLELVIGWQRG